MSETTDYGASNTGANEESLRMVSSQPIGNEPVSDEELRPHVLEGFIGQPRLKAQLQLLWTRPANAMCHRTIFCLPALASGQNHVGHDRCQ